MVLLRDRFSMTKREQSYEINDKKPIGKKGGSESMDITSLVA